MNDSTLAAWLFSFLLNALWKIALLYAAAWLITRLSRKLGAPAEHRIWVGALLLAVFLPALHLRFDDLWSRCVALLFSHHGSGHGEVHVLFGPGRGTADLLHMPSPLVRAMLIVYSALTIFFTVRLLWGLWKTHLLTRSAVSVEISEETKQLWQNLCGGMELSSARIQIGTAANISSPMIVGIRRIWVLLPPGFLEDADSSEFAAALAHECAHIRRHDFAKNLLYSVLALPVAFHPLVWRMLAGITESRELICDDIASASSNGRTGYARSLLRLAERLTLAPTLHETRSLQAIGIFDANIFERRIMRLTHPPTQVRGLRRFATITLCALAATTVCASALAWRVEINPATSMEDPPKRMHVKANVMQGNLISQVQPVYPPDAKTAGIQGAVILDAVIGKDGVPEQLRVKDGPKALQQSSLDAVRQWRYKPFLLNGDPIEVETTVTITYNLGK
jgi:TonB family protein